MTSNVRPILQAFPALTNTVTTATAATAATTPSPSAEMTLKALDQAFEQMVGIAGIPEEEEMTDDALGVVTPRASTSSSNGTPGTPGRGSTSSMIMEPLVECHKPKARPPPINLENSGNKKMMIETNSKQRLC